MKRDTLKIGDKVNKDKAFTCQYNRPENAADCLKIAQGNEAIVAAMFNRGYTIVLQDRVGRPLFSEGADAATVQKALDEFVLGVSKGRGRPAAPRIVTIPKGKKQFSPEEVAEMLKQARITVVQQ